MDQNSLLERRKRALGPAYRLFYDEPLHLVRGQGMWLFGADGRRYLDCYNNVASVGHCHPRVVSALSEQAAMLSTHTRYLHENVVHYAERLAATLPGELSVCMFCCTGTEANDLALRLAQTVTGHEGVIVLEQAYHGNSKTVFELSPEDYPEDEQPAYLETVPPPDSYRGPLGRGGTDTETWSGQQIDRAVEELASRGFGLSMFIADNVFSSNGVLIPPPGYLQAAYERVRSAGGLVVADEVQSGLCRLGDHYWAFEDSGVVPDIVTMGKPLGGGHPVAAVVTTPAIAGAFAERYHYFNTFGGNPVSAAAGLAVLDVIEEEDILRNVRDTGRYLRQGLLELMSRHERIGDVRGKGLFFGIELVADRETREPAPAAANRVREFLREHGVLLGVTGPLGNVVKIRPPLVFRPKHADRLLQTLEEAFQCVA